MADSLAVPKPWRSFRVLVVSPTPTHPQDHGNRKRIFEICAALQRLGAAIDFVHYPGEHDWRSAWPIKHENAMRAAWDAYQLVAPSRPLHSDSLGEDHDIDEWADPGLEHFISWACRVRAYDMMIVNYTWMSFCLKAAPNEVFKVCDTHDVFGDRRLLLQQNGIDPEFFHTTREGERLGLERADLVWAIKKSEQDHFERDLGLAACLTMLHAEPERGWWTRPPSTDGFLRAGVIGARNNINRRNLEEFFAEALPVFEQYMAPVKIVIAGGCSEDFLGFHHPNVEVIGRVPEVEGFYRGVDVAIAPMRFSTGLKIKVSEALASGAPVVAHAHAMDGYPTSEPLHQLHSFRDLALELVKLAFDPSPLPKLAARSRKLCVDIQKSVDAAFEATRQRLVAKTSKTICVVAPMEAFDPASLLHDHLLAALDYLRFTAGLTLYVTGAPAKKAKFDALARFDLVERLFADPALVEALGDKAPENLVPIELADLIQIRGFTRAYLMADCRDALWPSTGALRQVYVRHDAIELGGGDAGVLIDALRPHVEVVVVGAAPARIVHWQGEKGVAQVVFAPFKRDGAFESFQRRPKAKKDPADMIVLARASDFLAAELVALARRLGRTCALVDPADPGAALALRGRLGPADQDPLAGFSNLRLLVDLTEHDPFAIVLGEAALRLAIPALVFQRGALAAGLHIFAPSLYPTSIARLFNTFARAAVDDAALEALRAEARREATSRFACDAGWTALWPLLRRGGQEKVASDAAELLLG